KSGTPCWDDPPPTTSNSSHITCSTAPISGSAIGETSTCTAQGGLTDSTGIDTRNLGCIITVPDVQNPPTLGWVLVAKGFVSRDSFTYSGNRCAWDFVGPTFDVQGIGQTTAFVAHDAIVLCDRNEYTGT